MDTNGRELPVACTLGAVDAREREQRWRAIAGSAMLAAERTATGARQTYLGGADVEGELSELIDLEAQCCAFLDFKLDRADDRLTLDISGPPDAAPVIELFVTTSE